MLLHWLGEFLRGVGMNPKKFTGYLFLLVRNNNVCFITILNFPGNDCRSKSLKFGRSKMFSGNTDFL
jgi:hypothetical protein